MKKLFLLISFVFISICVADAQTGWNAQIKPEYGLLRSVFFTDPLTGYVVGGDTIMKTIDGGETWTAQTNPFPKVSDLNSVFFIKDTGYAIGRKTGNGLILKTINGGSTWTEKPCGISHYYHSCYFINSKTGYAITDTNLIKTSDGGNTWTKQMTGATDFLTSIFFIKDTGYAVGYNGNIVKTIDGGQSWTVLKSGTGQYLNSVFFTDSKTGYVVGGSGLILKTTNGGTTWIQQTGGTNYAFYTYHSVFFSDANTGYICGYNWMDDVLLKTIDGGITWKPTKLGYYLTSMYFIGDTGYAVGLAGLIAKTTTGGENSFVIAMDSVKNNDSITYCHGFDSIKLIRPSGCTGLVWTYNNYHDTLNNKDLVLAGNYNGMVTCSYSKGGIVNHIAIYPQPISLSVATQSVSCSDSVKFKTRTNYKGTGTYIWSPSTYLDNPNSANPIGRIKQSINYTVSMTTPDGCQVTAYDTIKLAPAPSPNICMVSIDSTNKGVIIWDKNASTSIDSFFIYKETNVTNNYKKIGSVPYKNLSLFRDSLSNPDIQSYKYEISIKDKCGIESPKSSPHKTIHLTISKGIAYNWNLIWEAYEGFSYSTYKIYRGTRKSTMEKIAEVASSISSYTDLVSTPGTFYYQIEVVSPDTCNPSALKALTYYSTRSNVVNTEMLSTNDPFSELVIYPNPTTGIINITNDNVIRTEVLDITGMSQGLFYGKQIDLSGLSTGTYILNIYGKDGLIKREKIILSR